MFDTPSPRETGPDRLGDQPWPRHDEPAALSTWPVVPEAEAGLPRVLVIEDNPLVAETLVVLLALRGHEVRVSRNGADGVRMGAAWHPEVVVCDIGLPGLDGYAVAAALRQAVGPAVRLIALTGYESDEHRSRAGRAGFDHYLTKPADPAVLFELVKSR